MGSRGIWTFMSARTRRSLTLTWTALFVLSLLLQYAAFAAAPAALAAHDVGLFELDGNADDQAAPGADWENGPEGAADSFFVGASSEAAANDNTYFTTGGSKDENDIPSWAITSNSVPDKDELLDAYAAVYQLAGETWVYFGADRFDNDGDAQIGFWFFQDNVGIAGGDFTGQHVDGDVLILSEYTNGGVVDLVCAYEWDGSGGGDNIASAGNCDPATNGSNLNLVAAGAACDVSEGTFDICARTNAAITNAPWTFENKDGDNDFGIGQFFEGGINLSDMFGGEAPCFGAFLAETRSSQETDAQLKDFALGDFNTCVPPDITTTSSVSTADFGQTVTDTANLSGSNGAVTGTVDFFICTPAQVTAAGCPAGSGSLVTDNAAINAGVAVSTGYTIGLTAAAAGTYCWRAEYTPSASSDYLAASHTNATTECFTVAPPTIDITKTANPAGPVSAGDQIGFDITVTNTGTTTAHGVTVSDPLPAGVNWAESPDSADCSISGAVGSQTLACGPRILAAGASFSVHIQGLTDAADCGVVSNTANVTTGNDGSDSATATVTVNCPDVTVAKTPDAGSVQAGQSTSFTILVSNAGQGSASNVTLTDNLPVGYTWSLGGADAASCSINTAPNPDVLSCNFGTLAAGATRTITLTTLTSGSNCAVIPNTATVAASNEPASANGNNSDSGSIDVLCANVTIVKNATPVGPVNAGDEIGFDIVVTNNGDGTATDVHVSDDLPSGITWTADPATGSTTGLTCLIVSGDLVCDDASMAAGDTFTVHVHGLTDAADCGTVNNTAFLTTGNDGAGNDGASVVVQCPDVSVVKSGNGPLVPGDTATFTITVSNVGLGQASNVHVTDPLPAGVTWSITPPVTGCAIVANTLDCTFPTLAAGANVTITIVGAVDGGDCGPLPNLVTVSASNEPAGATGNNSDDATIVVECADVSVEKTADVTPISAGETAAFSITVTNNGPDTAVNVVLDDTLPAGVAWAVSNVTLNGSTISNPCDAIAGGTLHCDLGDLAVDDVVVIHIGGDTDFEDCGTLLNSVIIGADNEPAGADANNADDASIVVDCPELGIAKTADHEAPVVAGTPIGFTITVVNNGDGTAFDVNVNDTLDSGFSWTIQSQAQTPPAPAINDFTLVGNALSFSGNLPAHSQISVHVVANTDFEDCGLVPNTAFLSQGETPVDDNSAAEEVRCPEIGIDKTSNDEDGAVDAGQTVTFTILAQVAEGPVTDAVITDTLPVGQTYVVGSQSSTPAEDSFTVSADGRTLTWTYASLDDGDPAVTITYDVTIDAAADSALTNVVELCVAEVPTCESAEETVSPNPELGIAKSNDAPLVSTDIGNGQTVDLPTAEEGDTVTYTLDYTVKGEVNNAVITDVLPEGVTYVNGTASSDAQFTFSSYNPATRTLTWTADVVSENGSLTYDATIDEGAAELAQPLVNVATIDSDETEPDSDDSPVFVAPVPLALTPPPTDALAPSAAPANPGFTLMLILLAVAGFALAIGFITPVPEHVRRRDRLG
ncbi:MAG: isopeptide-forming domain-containing fimbrial protein [Chloroflexota bacterium]